MQKNTSDVIEKVLIVDDEKTNLKILSDILRNDVEITLAKDGHQAIKKANTFHPDLIILDIVMPGMDGFEVIKQLKSGIQTSHIPVIFITALNDVESEEKALRLGACDYIHKPFNVVIVKARVKLHLKIARQQALLEKLANIDPLTSIANRRKYTEMYEIEWRSAIRKNTSLSLVVIDIDFFKKYNDRYGHAAGDRVLEKVARKLSQQLHRPRDFIARYGGEEFVLILPDTDYQGTMSIMQACCESIKALQIEHIGSEPFPIITISAGGFCGVPGKGIDKQKAFNIADDMLYQAKQQGRCKVLCHRVVIK